MYNSRGVRRGARQAAAMAPNQRFNDGNARKTHMMLPFTDSCPSTESFNDEVAHAFYEHVSAPRIGTDAVLMRELRKEHPSKSITIVDGATCDLLSYAAAGFAKATIVTSTNDHLVDPLVVMGYAPPAQRMGGGLGIAYQSVEFAKLLYRWENNEWIMYIATGRDGTSSYPQLMYQYLVGQGGPLVMSLVKKAGSWLNELHDEIWVFDQGFWSKSPELYASVMRQDWKDVILDAKEKAALQDDVLRFFNSQERYQNLRVPWKRGVIYHGPPGNGKTISIKAMMHTLYSREEPIPTCYVRSLSSFGGPEYSIGMIFGFARRNAPCLLVLEDLDSLIDDNVRSYFLNEVDGLTSNDGIMMIGSTNHLDRLDPGLAKRPSRFDRKFLFDKPDEHARILYAEYWRNKLLGKLENPNATTATKESIEFPKAMCPEVAKITYGFSFAYIQEAFVASLLAIAADDDDDEKSEFVHVATKDEFEDVRLWRELRKQVSILRHELDNGDDEDASKVVSSRSR